MRLGRSRVGPLLRWLLRALLVLMLVGLGLGWSGASAGPALTATSNARTSICNPAARDTQAAFAPTPHLNQQSVPTRRGGDLSADGGSRHTGAGTAGVEPGVGSVDEAFHAIVTDLVGAPSRLVGPDGSTVWSRSALLWGEPGRVGDLMPLRFPGQFADAETGLVYNVFRYYDPVNARYISSDPLGQVPGPNTYAYVSNPTTLTDPLGLSPCGADFIASADGVIVPTSRSRMVQTFEEAGLASVPTRAPGTQYTLPDGSLVRIMEPSGSAPLRASFTDAYENAVNPFTGMHPQPPPGVSGAAWRQLRRELTHPSASELIHQSPAETPNQETATFRPFRKVGVDDRAQTQARVA
ncbi:RHS repeat-associated core domain-containing protein, partial [Knoellia koreensis]|nr:hypothetical protein [Knoellia sp. DB2414S]